MKLKLTQGEINSYADDISKVLEDIPLFYVYEILELANEQRQKEGEIPELDVSSSEDEDESSSEEEVEEEEDNEE